MNAYFLLTLLLLPLAGLAALWLLRLREPRTRGTTLQPRNMLQRDAQAMYLRLRAALPQYIIFARASLAAFVEVKGKNRAAVAARQAELAGQTVDFLICSSDFQVLAAVELEDVVRGRSSHEHGGALVREAAIPVLRWTTANLPTARDIQEAIAELETLRLIRSGMQSQSAAHRHQGSSAGGFGWREPRL